ncbi:MAG: hypothetical protein ACERKS_03865 [Candidatus Bathyarchaeota archaeon]
MADSNLISRCGIYCGACYVYRAERDVGEFLREVAQWQEKGSMKSSATGAPRPSTKSGIIARIATRSTA